MFRLQYVRIIVSLAIGAVVLIVVTHSTGSANQLASDVSSPTGAGAAKDSLFQQANLTKAITVYDKKFGPGKIDTFKIEPGALKVSSATGEWIVGKHFETSGAQIPAEAGAALGSQGTIDTSDIDPAVPAKILSELAPKGVTLATVNYFLVSRDFTGSGKIGWGIYTTNGDFTAHANGSHAVALGSSDSTQTTVTGGGVPSTSSIAKHAKSAEKAAQSQASSATDEATCVENAGTDVSKIEACTGG
jgi:hypothetical protein